MDPVARARAGRPEPPARTALTSPAGPGPPLPLDPLHETHLVGTPAVVLHDGDLRPSHALPPRPARTTARHAAPEQPRALTTLLWTLGVPLLLVALGAAIRVRQWAVGRSLWLDEALIGESLVSRDYSALVSEPLLHNQAAPVLWLWAERLAIDLFGTDERVLRIVPMLAGFAVLGLTWALARRLLPAVAVPVPVAIVALHPALTYYANEVKQYSSDVAVVLVLVLLALRALRSTRDLAVLSAAGAVLLWLSHAAVLALSGISLVLVLRDALRGRWRAAAVTAAVLTGWLVSLAVAFVLVLDDLRHNPVLEDYWAYTFPTDTSPAGLVDWLGRRWLDLADTPLGLRLPELALAVLALAALRLLWVARARGAVALAIVAMATLAASLAAYPFAGRLSLWLVPLAALALGALVPDRMDLPRAAWLLAVTMALTLTVVPGLRETLPRLVEAQYVEELEPVLRQVAAERQPGDQLLVHIAARGGYDYYERFIPVRRDGVVLLIESPPQGCDDRIALRTGRFATERVWVVFSHELVDTGRLGSTADLIARIQTVSSIARTIQAPGSQAFLFDPVAGPQAVQPTTYRNPQRCLGVYRASR